MALGRARSGVTPSEGSVLFPSPQLYVYEKIPILFSMQRGSFIYTSAFVRDLWAHLCLSLPTRTGWARPLPGRLLQQWPGIRLNLKCPRPFARSIDLDCLIQLLSWARVSMVRLPLVLRALHFDLFRVLEIFLYAALILCVPANTFWWMKAIKIWNYYN